MAGLLVGFYRAFFWFNSSIYKKRGLICKKNIMDISCPKCGSHDLHAEKSGIIERPGFHDGKGHERFGLGGDDVDIAQRRNQIIITCLACGHQFYPGKDHLPVDWGYPAWQYKLARVVCFIIAGICAIFCLVALATPDFGVFAGGLLIGAVFVFLGIRSKKKPVQ